MPGEKRECSRHSVGAVRALGQAVPLVADAEVDGIPVSSGYDGPGSDRVRFLRILRGP
jgi:hypothetical protein